MNKKTKEFKRWRLIQSINSKDRKEGFVKLYPNNTYDHEMVKCKVAYKLKKQGYSIYSECRFSDGSGRADLVAISQDGVGYILEIVHSESEKRFSDKLDKYPIEFNLVKIECKNFNIHSWEL